MGTAKSPGLGHARPCMGVMAVTVVSHGSDVMDVTDVTDVSLGTVVMGETQVESRGRVATHVTLITGIAAQRAETRTSEVTHGILHTGDYIH